MENQIIGHDDDDRGGGEGRGNAQRFVPFGGILQFDHAITLPFHPFYHCTVLLETNRRLLLILAMKPLNITTSDLRKSAVVLDGSFCNGYRPAQNDIGFA